jgi:hypothetical protein
MDHFSQVIIEALSRAAGTKRWSELNPGMTLKNG